MCIKLIKRGGAIVGFQFDRKRIVATIMTFAGLLTATGIITAKCGSVTAKVQEKMVLPVAEKCFAKMHKPYDSTLENIAYNQQVTIEMIKLISNNPEILNQAIDRVENTGKFRTGKK